MTQNTPSPTETEDNGSNYSDQPNHPISTERLMNNSTLIRTKTDLFSITKLIDIENYRRKSRKFSIASIDTVHSIKVARVPQNSLPQIQTNKIFPINPNYNRLQGPTVAVRRVKDVQLDAFVNSVNDPKTLQTKQSKPCFNKCLIISSIVIALLIIGVITAVLVISLVKSETKRKVTATNKVAVLRWNKTGITVIGMSGVSGNASNLLFEPWDLAMDWSNAIYVTEIRNNRVQKFSLNSQTGVTVAGLTNSTGCSSLNCLKSPLGIIVDDNKNLYISDRDNDRVVYWSNGASTGTLYAGTGIGSALLNALQDPYGLAHDSSSNKIYIADFSNHRVVHRSQTNSSINVIVAGGNGNGTNGSQLILPNAVHYDAFTQSLLIVNTGGHNVVRWTLGANNWTLAGGGTTGPGSTQFHLRSPTDVTLDPMGNMYVVDRNNQRIQFFSSGQLNGTTIAGATGVNGSNATVFSFPASMILDNQLNLYVVDRYNHRVQKFLRY